MRYYNERLEGSKQQWLCFNNYFKLVHYSVTCDLHGINPCEVFQPSPLSRSHSTRNGNEDFGLAPPAEHLNISIIKWNREMGRNPAAALF